jgi:hypothetical protein
MRGTQKACIHLAYGKKDRIHHHNVYSRTVATYPIPTNRQYIVHVSSDIPTTGDTRHAVKKGRRLLADEEHINGAEIKVIVEGKCG